MRCFFIVAVLTLAALWLPYSATCQEMSELDPRFAIIHRIAIGMRLDDHLRRMRDLHRRTDLSSDGFVSIADFEEYRARASAAGRDHAIRELLRYDIDGDGVVTRAEVVQTETDRVQSKAQNDPNIAGREVLQFFSALIERPISECARTWIGTDASIRPKWRHLSEQRRS